MIEGELVRLRALEPEDAERLHPWTYDPEVGRWMNNEHPLSLAQVRKRCEERATNTYGKVVLGIEADWQASDLNGSGIFPNSVGTLYNIGTNVKDYGSVRGRLGFAFDRWMLFGTAGWAWGSWNTSYGFAGAPGPFVTMNVQSTDGWTAGAGIEYAFTNNFLGRVEYRYTDLGRASFVDIGTNSAELGNRVTINDVRVGLAYKF